MTAAPTMLGIIAGGGALPVALARRCEAHNRPFLVIRLRGFADQSLEELPGIEAGIAETGRILDLLQRHNCKSICLVGYVKRPDLHALKPDWRGVKFLGGAIAAAQGGDDALMRYVVQFFEQQGFTVEGADDVDDNLALPAGVLGSTPAPDSARGDIERALEVARAIGSMDVGQGAVVVGGLVIAVEAQEGTDAMLKRCAALPQDIRGTAQARRGVLAKCAKPIQELRIDLPTIGVATVEAAAAAGLAGIVGEAGRMLVLDREAVIRAADRLGVFILGVEAP